MASPKGALRRFNGLLGTSLPRRPRGRTLGVQGMKNVTKMMMGMGAIVLFAFSASGADPLDQAKNANMVISVGMTFAEAQGLLEKAGAKDWGPGQTMGPPPGTSRTDYNLPSHDIVTLSYSNKDQRVFSLLLCRLNPRRGKMLGDWERVTSLDLTKLNSQQRAAPLPSAPPGPSEGAR